MEPLINSNQEPLLAHVERSREERRRLYGKLCCVGVYIRFLTFCNAFALLGACGYSLYEFGYSELMNTNLAYEWRIRGAVEYFLMAFSGLFLFFLESTTSSNEAGARSSLGLAFSGAGRFWLLVFLALISLPAVHTQRSLLEFYVTAGTVGGLLVAGGRVRGEGGGRDACCGGREDACWPPAPPEPSARRRAPLCRGC